MRLAAAFVFLWAWVSIGCTNSSGPSGSDPHCINADCIHPPADTCIDAHTLREYDPQGTCDPDTDACAYAYTDQACEQGCAKAACVFIDPCADVVCDHPPPARCLDESKIEEFDPDGTCEATYGQCVYIGRERTCPDGCVQGLCLDPGEEYSLAIPMDTQVCSEQRSSWDVFESFNTRMRISFHDGMVSLPLDEPWFERDWIASIEFGPERVLLQPQAAGTFTLTASATQNEYEFVQMFSDGSLTYTLTYKVRFDPEAADKRLQIFDELYLSPPLTWPADSIDLVVIREDSERWDLFTCRYDLYLPVVHRVHTADGAELVFEERYYPSEDCVQACPTALVEASYDLGAEHRLVSDPFRLGFSDGQHNWFDRFLVVFDAPVGDIHGLHYFPSDSQYPEKKVDHLDAELSPKQASLVESHTIIELWTTFDAGTVPVTTCTEYCRDHLGLAENCEPACIVEGQMVAGRCFTTQQWPPSDDWTPIACEDPFSTCTANGRPFIQCCCSRIAGDWRG